MTNFIDIMDDSLLETIKKDVRYENSKFKNLRYLPPRTKGSIFEKIGKDLFHKLGYSLKRPVSTDHDIIVNGQKVEIKGSTLVMNKNVFSFLQIRPDQDYEKIVFILAYPKELKMVEMDKKNILNNIENGIFRKQHGGKKSNSGTFCYYGNYETLLSIGGTPVKNC